MKTKLFVNIVKIKIVVALLLLASLNARPSHHARSKKPSYASDTPPGKDMPVEATYRGYHSRNVPKDYLVPRPHINMDDLLKPPNDPKKPDPKKEEAKDNNKIINFASKFLGIPYVWGGSSPKGFDCSGFTMYVYAHFGKKISHSTRGQFRSSLLKPVKKLKSGDIIFFKINKRSIGHVGLYAGNNRFLHSPRTGKTVEFANLKLRYWKSRYAGARRMR